MAARRLFWKWQCWKSIGFCLWPPSTCIWNLKLKFQSKLDLCSGNHVVYRQTDGQTDRRTRWIQYTPPPTSLGGGIKMYENLAKNHWHFEQMLKKTQTLCFISFTGSGQESSWNKWPPFHRWHFQRHFLEWKLMNFNKYFTEICSYWSN